MQTSSLQIQITFDNISPCFSLLLSPREILTKHSALVWRTKNHWITLNYKVTKFSWLSFMHWCIMSFQLTVPKKGDGEKEKRKKCLYQRVVEELEILVEGSLVKGRYWKIVVFVSLYIGHNEHTWRSSEYYLWKLLKPQW